ncbi:unnamed protein product, partial [marine sediment metagenome]
MQQPLTHSIESKQIKIAWEGGILFLGKLIGGVLKWLSQVIIARLVGPAMLGLYMIGLALLQILTRIADLGLQSGTLRYVSLYRGVNEQEKVKGTIISALGLSLIGGIILGFLFFLLSPFLANSIFHKAQLTPVLKIFAFALPFFTIMMVAISITQSFQVMKYSVWGQQFFHPIINIFLIVILVKVGLKVAGPVWAFAGASLLTILLLLIFIHRLFPDIFRADVKSIFQVKELTFFSFPLAFAGFFSFPLGTTVDTHFG